MRETAHSFRRLHVVGRTAAGRAKIKWMRSEESMPGIAWAKALRQEGIWYP